MKRILSLFTVTFLIITYFVGCGKTELVADNKVSIVTTIFPHYDFTREIVGENANVTMLLKPGAESHSYEPTPQDIKTIQNADLFVYTGGENDVWVDDILASMGNDKPDTLRLLDCVTTVNEEIVEGMEHEHHDHQIKESDIKERNLADFTGAFQSMHPYLESGVLDEYITHEAEEHESSFDDMKRELLAKRATEYQTMQIKDNLLIVNTVTGSEQAEYSSSGYRTIANDEGEITGVWYIFELKEVNKNMPKFLAINDHNIQSHDTLEDSDVHEEMAHFHIRYGNESIDALMEITNWAPTFYSSEANGEEIKEELIEHDHEHEEEVDEHVWTSPKNAMQIVQKLSSILEEKDKEHANIYRKNSETYIEKLKVLDNAFIDVVANSKNKTILFGDRFPFRYLADDYGLTYYAAFSGCATETEASAATVAFLIDKVKEDKLSTVFTIEFSNGKIADSICDATGAKKLVLHSCHNISKEELEEGETYLSLMESNVQSLKEALN